MMVISRKRSISDVEKKDTDTPEELRNKDYEKEVLQLKDEVDETATDEALVKGASAFGIIVAHPTTAGNCHTSLCDSAITVGSKHDRCSSMDSQGSASTGMTSRSSDEHLGLSNEGRPTSRRQSSVSFSEYESFLEQVAMQQVARNSYPSPMPAEPTPSLFSVSTRRSYASIKSNFKNRFKIRRGKTSTGNLM
jgi:hypothetical protein